MPIFFSNSLEQSLHRAVALANEGRCEYVTLEHLLLALIEDQDAAAAMRASKVDLEKLRRDLLTCIGSSELDNLVTHGSSDAEPTQSFQHAIQYAVIHVQSSGRVQVTGADAIIGILADCESQAAALMQEQGMTR
jgi:ATP-dependent Clp protease ATP-binding subunit ClpA